MKRRFMKRKTIWYGILFIFFAGFISFAFGFYNALSIGIDHTQTTEPMRSAPSGESSERSEEVKNVDSKGVQIMVLGDSLARGTGDPEGEGFAGRVAQGLEEKFEEPVALYNFAMEGMRSAELVDQLEDKLIMQGIGKARYMLVSIGGNDLRTLARLPLVQQDQAFEESLQDYLDNLNKVMERLRSVNEEALVMFIGLYHPDENSPNARESDYLLVWNYETQRLLETHAKVQLVPTYDLFQFNLGQYMSLDGLHPSAPGYEAIAKRILKNLPE